MKKRAILQGIISVALLTFFFLEMAESEQESQINISIVDDSISVDCKQAKLEDVVTQISNRMGLDCKIYPDMIGKLITTKFENLSFAEAVQKVVGENYAIVYAGDKLERVEKLYILRRGKDNENYELIQAYHQNIFPPLRLLTEVVQQHVTRRHNAARFYEVIPHYDLDGKLMSYVFTYYIGSDEIPDRETLDKGISRAWEEKKIAIDNIHKAYHERDSEKISKASAESKKASLGISRENDFLSLEVGASYEAPPVIAIWSGLPLDISQYPRAMDVAKQLLKDKEPKFKSTFTTGLFGIVFAFEGNDNKTYYIEPDNWRIFTSWKKVKKDADKKQKGTGSTKRNKSKWVVFLDI